MPNHQASSNSHPGIRGLDPSPQVTRRELLVIVLLMVMAAVLVIPGIDQHLWYDELYTLLHHVRSPAVEIITQSRSLNNHVLYSLSAHFTTTLFGESAWSLRLPALIFGIATIPALYYFARQIASWHVAVLASVFLTFNYFFLWFSQNARGYTGAMLGGLLATILFIRILGERRASAGLLASYSVVATLTAWVQLTGLAVPIAHGLVWLLISTGPAQRGDWARSLRQLAALVGAIVLPILLNFPIIRPIFRVLQARFLGPTDSAASVAENGSQVISLADKGVDLTGTLQAFLQPGIGQLMPGARLDVLVLTTLVLTAVLVAGIIACWRRGRSVFGLLVIPVLVSVLTAIFAAEFFAPRFIFVAFPFMLLLGVMGGYQLARWMLPFLTTRQVMIAGLLIAAIGTVRIPDVWKPKQNFEAATDFINSNKDESVAMVCIGLIHADVIQYYKANCVYARHVDDLLAIEERHDEIFVLHTLNKHSTDPGMKKRLASSYVLERRFPGTLRNGEIIVMRKRD